MSELLRTYEHYVTLEEAKAIAERHFDKSAASQLPGNHHRPRCVRTRSGRRRQAYGLYDSERVTGAFSHVLAWGVAA
jgi:hypothetical protein